MSSDPPGARPPLLKSMDEAMTDAMIKLTLDLTRLNDGRKWFNEPVDWRKHKLWAYPEVIPEKSRMDLGTVMRQLEEDKRKPFPDKRYQFAEEYAHDVRLVWKNALIFNVHGHITYKAAKTMSAEFEKRLLPHYKEAEKQGAPCPLKVRCQLLLSDLQRNPLSEWFRREREWKAMGEVYLLSITSGKPMDLDQVQSRLSGGEYEPDGGPFSVDAYARDMRLIFQNAMEFNREGVFWLCAKILLKHFDDRLELLRSCPVPTERGKRKEDREGFPAFERKRDVARKCARLSALRANEVANAVRQGCPEAVSSKTVGGVPQTAVDLDAVDEATFAKVEAGLPKG